ncbi:MAG: hypothetical protein COB41_02595 [Proteobacteria bacterium]|nr:MAG: hypothetical protein COB41_02595 [Pseudomonadota bacterium]
MNIKDAMKELMDIDGATAAMIVDSDSGMILAQSGGGLNLDLAAAGNTEVVRAKRKTMASLKLDDHIEDFLITLGKQFHILRPLKDKQNIFIYSVLDKSRANLGMARLVIAGVESNIKF